MRSKTLVVIGILLTVGTHCCIAEICEDPAITAEYFSVMNKNTGQELHTLPLHGSSYELAVDGSFHIKKTLNPSSFSAKVHLWATVSGLYFGFWPVTDMSVPENVIGCPLPGNICEFTEMTCESGLEYLGLSHSIKCPVQEGRLKIVYSSLGKSPDVYKIGQQMSLDIEKFVIHIGVTFTDNDTKKETLCFQKDLTFQ